MGLVEVTKNDSTSMHKSESFSMKGKLLSQHNSKERIAQRYRDACQKDSSIDHLGNSSTKYYIISSVWMNNFLTYASFSESATQLQYDKNSKIRTSPVSSADEKKSDSSYIDGISNHPGKIYNYQLIDSNLLQSQCNTFTTSANEVCGEANISCTYLKQGLSYGREYAIVGPSSWSVLSQCFGFDYILARPIKILPDERAAVEVYAQDYVGPGMRLVMLPLGGQWYIPNEIRQRNEIPDELPLLTNDLYPDNASEDEEENENEPGPNSTTNSNISSSQQLALVSLNSNYNDFKIDNPPARKKIRKMGRCGLSNLGNTCFMNSSLQCLSHTTPLRNYFLSDEYKEHLNRSNPLGTGGELAIEFAKLLHQMWRSGVNIATSYNRYYSDNSIVFSPSSFKAALGRNASQFIGYDQHDSQELATYLLDALHEDTNVVTNKPYVEKTEKKDDEDDHVAAARAWREYLRRDNSRIVESFMGQVKSRVQCPNENCLKVSTTFDPYMYLSVPIPGSQERIMTISFVPLDPTQNARKIKVTLLKSSTISCLEEKIGQAVGVAKEDIVIGDVWKNEIYSFYKSSNEVSLLKDTDEVWAYELEPALEITDDSSTDKNLNDHCNDQFILEINFRKDRIGYHFQSSNSASEIAFATPLVIRISSNLTVAGLRKILASRLKNFLHLKKYADELKQAFEKRGGANEEWSKEACDFPPLLPKKYVQEKQSVPNEAQKQLLENSSDNTRKGNESDNTTNDDSMSCESSVKDSQELIPSRIEFCFGEESNEELFMRNVPLTYQRKPSHSTYSRPPPRPFGSLEKKDIMEDVTKLTSPKDEREMQNVAEIVGNNGRLNLYWSSKMMDYIDSEKWDKVEEIPRNENTYLDKKKNETITLQKCIDNYCTKEQLEESDKWYCSNCKTHVRAWKQFHLYSTPPILIIQVKRFYFSSSSHRRDKISTFIDFPLDGLDLRGTVMNWKANEEPIYDCYAVSNHYGGLGGGHYTAYAKNNGQWCYFDDSRVSEVSDEKEVISEAAYVLYYHRRDLEDWDNIFPGSRGSSSPLLSTSSSSSSHPVSDLSMMPRAVALPKSLQSTYPDNSETSDKEMESVISSSNVTHASIGSPMGSLVTDDLSDDAATEGNVNSGSEMMN